MNPITPPRPRTQRKQQLYTPKTPFSTQKPNSACFNSPLRNDKQIEESTSMGILSPVETPYRKRKTLGDALDLGLNSQKCIFPPTPSTIGSGRVKYIPLKETKDLTKKKLSFSLTDDETEVEAPQKVQPLTPGKNMITEDLIDAWHGNDKYEEDSDMEDFIRPAKPMDNPFISSNPNKAMDFIIRKNNKPLDKIELVNKRGEKLTRILTDNDDELDEDEEFFQRRNLRNSLKSKVHGFGGV